MWCPVPERAARARAALAAALALAAAAPAAARAPGDARVTAEAEAFVRAWAGRRPAWATALGVPGARPAAVPRTPAARAADLAALRAAAHRVAALPADGLSDAARADRALLAGRIEAERIALEEAARDVRDPAAAIEELAHAVGLTLARASPGPCERVTRATTALAAAPEALRALRILAPGAPRAAVETAVERLAEAARAWRTGLGPLAGACREAHLQAPFAGADSQATEAADGLAAALAADVLPRAAEGAGLGADVLSRWLAAAVHESAPPDSLLARALRELAAARAALEAAAERVAPGAGARAALALIAADTARAADAVTRAGAAADPASARRRDGAPRLRVTPAWAAGRAPVRLAAAGAWETHDAPARLDLDPALAAAAGPWTTAFLALREGPAGRLGLLAAARARPVRWALAGPGVVEAWCDRAAERAAADGDPRLALAARAHALWRLARAVVEVSLHARGMRRVDAAEFLAEECLMAPPEAARAAREALSWPAALETVVARWQLDDLERETRAGLGARFDGAAFEAALIAEGPLPARLARQAVRAALGLAPERGP
uniref:DUF885 family protein n=1 Tax=Eiseniibacteriota bacterium TaxID=2212470 RepID=A0A832IC96_UNCEI